MIIDISADSDTEGFQSPTFLKWHAMATASTGDVISFYHFFKCKVNGPAVSSLEVPNYHHIKNISDGLAKIIELMVQNSCLTRWWWGDNDYFPRSHQFSGLKEQTIKSVSQKKKVSISR